MAKDRGKGLPGRDTPSEEEIRDALLRSGYLLEYRLETFLRERNYWVQANPVYEDPSTGKSRELDLRTGKKFSLDPENIGFLFAELVIECINNPHPIAFFTRMPRERILYRDDIKMSGYPLKIADKTPAGRTHWDSIQSYFGMQNIHHYCREPVATQFCSFAWKKNEKEWQALHGEGHFDSFDKLADATEHFIQEHYRILPLGADEPVEIRVYYPVVVVQGGLLDVRHQEDSLTIKPVPRSQYRMCKIVQGQEVAYHIDIVKEAEFSRYVEIIEDEVSQVATEIGFQRDLVLDSLHRVVLQARRRKTPKGKRKALEA